MVKQHGSKVWHSLMEQCGTVWWNCETVWWNSVKWNGGTVKWCGATVEQQSGIV